MDSLYLAPGPFVLRGSKRRVPMAPVEQNHQTDGPLLASISRAVVRIVHEYTGRGPTKARTSIRDDVVVVMLQETLLKAEHSLIRDSKAQLVVEMRRSFQQTMREDLSAAVAMLTEREVIAFMSDSHLEPDYSVELFVLRPEVGD
jgi:uncharacterized protein YbcI